MRVAAAFLLLQVTACFAGKVLSFGHHICKVDVDATGYLLKDSMHATIQDLLNEGTSFVNGTEVRISLPSRIQVKECTPSSGNWICSFETAFMNFVLR